MSVNVIEIKEKKNKMFLIYGILLLATTCKCKGQNVALKTTSYCYNVNDNMMLEAEYKGSRTIDGVIWTVTGGASGMLITVPACSSFSMPSGFPYGRMSYDCSFAPKYLLTIRTLDSADFNKTWGVYFSFLNGSIPMGIQQQTVTQCETVNEITTGFPRWAKVLIVLVVGVLAAILYGIYRQYQCLKDTTDEPTDEPNTCLTSLRAHVEIEDIRHESDNNFAKEFDEKNPKDEISNGDKVKTSSKKKKKKKKRVLH